MSCLDVMFYQSYGAHYLPASSAAAAAAYKAAYYHHQQHQQQKKLGVYSRMQQDSEEQQCPGGRQQQQRGGGGGRLAGEHWVQRGLEGSGLRGCGGTGKDNQPAEAEYLSSRCVLFTYFHGDIGDVVDEHFSRALNQTSAFTGEMKTSRTTPMHTSASVGLWKDSVSLSEAQCGSLSSSLWGGGYPSQTSPCLSVHPDFSPSPAAFHAPDSALWTGHVLPQPSLPHTASLPDPWAYSRNPQTSASYTHAHNVYTHPHTHMHPHHTHPVIHPHPSHDPGLDPRFSPLLLPGVKTQSPLAHSPAGHSTHSNTHSSQSPGIHSGVKIEVEQASPNPPTLTPSAWPAALHTPLDTYNSGLDQDKVNTVWF